MSPVIKLSIYFHYPTTFNVAVKKAVHIKFSIDCSERQNNSNMSSIYIVLYK